jgi:hypothetical protein
LAIINTGSNDGTSQCLNIFISGLGYTVLVCSLNLKVTVNVDCQLFRNVSIIEFFCIYIWRQSVMEGKSTYPEEGKLRKIEPPAQQGKDDFSGEANIATTKKTLKYEIVCISLKTTFPIVILNETHLIAKRK